MESLAILKAVWVFSESDYSACLDQDDKSALTCRAILVEIMKGIKKAEYAQSQTPSQQSAATLPATPPPAAVLNFPAPAFTITPFEDNDSSEFAFLNFESYFFNALRANPAMIDEQKFIYLKSLLRGRALGLLQQCDSALDPTLFDSALRLLERKFLRKDALTHSIAQSIIHHPQ